MKLCPTTTLWFKLFPCCSVNTMASSSMGKLSNTLLYRNSKLSKNPNKAENKDSLRSPVSSLRQLKKDTLDDKAELPPDQLLNDMSSSSAYRPGRARRFSNFDCNK